MNVPAQAVQRRLRISEEDDVLTNRVRRCREKFLQFFPKGFHDKTYFAWERGYKWKAHEHWNSILNQDIYRELLRKGKYSDAAARAVSVESRTHLLFSFEKMALRDAIKTPKAARSFARGLYNFLYGDAELSARFHRWCDVVNLLPRKKSRVLTHPVVTVFGFLAQPEKHVYMKPRVTKAAAQAYGFDLQYSSRPSWDTYASLLEFARVIRHNTADLKPRDMIDIQSFIWVQGSAEYDE
jgi:hypothetical protein